ncbi:MAG: hypothetical protein WA765_07185 [Candidatus Acidiferrum sp.]
MQLNPIPKPEDSTFDPRRVLLVLAVLLYTFVWLIQSILTRDLWFDNLLRPYLPGWALLAVGLSAPITVALVALRTIPWKISIFFAFLLPVQGGLFGLVGERYRLVQGAVTLFAFFEVYVLLPRINRRIEDRSIPRDGTVLHLK